MRRIVIVGGVAAGMSAASQAKRRDPTAEVVVLERGPYVSYGACGMPYNIADPAREIDDLVVITPERFREERGIDVRTRHEAAAVDVAGRSVHVLRPDGPAYDLPFDALVLATGAHAVRPPLPGLDLPGVFVLRELTDGAAIKRFVAARAPTSAVLVGAGYIGMEMAEGLRTLGLDVTVLEKVDQILPGFDGAVVDAAATELARRDVRVETGISVSTVEEAGGRLRVGTDRGAFHAGLVVVSVGVRPTVALARTAGVALGPTGAIAVDDGMRTNVQGIYAAGDCAEAQHLVTGRPAWIPLGTTANKQGKVAGANAAGGAERFGGIVGTAAFKLFGLEIGRTGLGAAEAAREGLEAVPVRSTQRSRGHAYPGAATLTTTLFVERATGRLLGAQMAGAEGVAGRIDVYATALAARMTVAQIADLDLAYAPPLAPVYDPILVAASVAGKALASRGREGSR